MTAFAVDQGALPAGVLDVTRSDLLLDGSEIEVTTDVAGELVLRWVPVGDVGSVATLLQDGGDPLRWTFAPTPGKPGSYVLQFTPDAGGDPVVRVHRARAPNGTVIPAFNEKADADADLVNSGAAFVAASQDNEPKGGIAYAGWWFTYHDALLALDALRGAGTFHTVEAGKSREIPAGAQLHGPDQGVTVDGGVTLDGGLTLPGQPAVPVTLEPVGAGTTQIPGGRLVRVPVNPSGGAVVLVLANRARPGDEVEIKNRTSSTNAITVRGNGSRIDGAVLKTMNTARELLRLRRGRGWQWDVVS